MPRNVGWLIALGTIAIAGCLHAPLAWSPDGRWLAYTVPVVAPDQTILAPGWLFQVRRPLEDEREAKAARKRPSPIAYRIWATRAESGTSVLLEESRKPLTAPAWSGDGRALAFGRVVGGDKASARFEIVVQDAPDHQRVLVNVPCGEVGDRIADLPALAPVWSPDSRYLAIPVLQTQLGLAIVRADNGRVLKTIEDARLPSWSPDGTRLVFVRGYPDESLHSLDANLGAPRHLADLGHVSQPPIWSRDSHSLFVVGRRRPEPGKDPLAQQSELIRVPLDGGKVETTSLDTEPIERDAEDRGVSFTYDPVGENVFFPIDAEGGQCVVTWFRPQKREVHKKFNPVDFSVRVGSLSVSPNGRLLAFRPGEPKLCSAPGLWDLNENRLTPLVPDDGARVQWIVTLISGASEILRNSLPPLKEDERAVERATLLPVPGEIAANAETAFRLRRIGRTGRPLCDRPADAPPASKAVEALLVEARLFFDYLRGDYNAALAALEELESRTTDPEHRLRLLSVRAQIAIGLGEELRAKDTIAYLQSIEQTAPKRYEITPDGISLIEKSDPGQGWPKYLANKHAEACKNGALNQAGFESRERAAAEMEMPVAPAEPMDLRKDDLPAMLGDIERLPLRLPRIPRRLDGVPPQLERPDGAPPRPGRRRQLFVPQR